MALCSCASPRKFEVEIIPTVEGVSYHVITTKNYGIITATGTKDENGNIDFTISAEAVDATSLAIKTIETQGKVIEKLSELIPK